MKNSPMLRGTIVLALCLFAGSMTLLAKKMVERPLKAKANSVMVVNLVDGSFTAFATGQATHGGLYWDSSEGFVDLSSGELVIVHGDGIIINASGAEAYYVSEGTGGYWVGGAGRFEGLTGEFSFELLDAVATVDGLTLTITFSYTVSGTMIY